MEEHVDPMKYEYYDEILHFKNIDNLFVIILFSFFFSFFIFFIFIDYLSVNPKIEFIIIYLT